MSSSEFCFIYLNLSLLGGGVRLEWGAWERRAGAGRRQRHGQGASKALSLAALPGGGGGCSDRGLGWLVKRQGIRHPGLIS